ncbi:MAG: Prolipoprotein diacylglyceryl transferase [Bacteroidetes bacterium ADurb.BinA012]|jgi:prolipoprotein diacylglyceryltransferase|nr:MAG: Prolipoprotein diacylglyceryl transferase [Bacteroidetes bacterium ADurb.BinA012]
MRIYWKKAGKPLPGLLFGLFLILVFGFRFLVEYIKEDQVAFEAGMKLNMGQWLSIPLVLAGIVLLIWVFTRKPAPKPVTEPWSPQKGVPKR